MKLVAASLFARLWFAGLAGWLPGVVAVADGALAALILVALLKPASDLDGVPGDGRALRLDVTPSSTRSNLRQ